MEKKLGRTPYRHEVFKKTHVKKNTNESDPNEWVKERAERTYQDYERHVREMGDSVQLTPEQSTQIWTEKVVGGSHKGRIYGMDSRTNVRRLQSGLEGIGSSRQADAIDGVQIAAMSQQIAELTRALAESEKRRIKDKKSMNEQVEQIKEQVLNLARQPSPRYSRASTPDDSDDSDEYIENSP
ncbi:uncharacterized protein LOC129898746 [Solanum dulcamara]|uniref:uncharacterized protein LOC129898746 n=1 Tax=Solanum dulcamara TaxID=45834 RepID=UPI002485F2AE|nr:uncharacterized protein LOC129898746 [Solanum dulcamara]